MIMVTNVLNVNFLLSGTKINTNVYNVKIITSIISFRRNVNCVLKDLLLKEMVFAIHVLKELIMILTQKFVLNVGQEVIMIN